MPVVHVNNRSVRILDGVLAFWGESDMIWGVGRTGLRRGRGLRCLALRILL